MALLITDWKTAPAHSACVTLYDILKKKSIMSTAVVLNFSILVLYNII
jgi:hypothetical protein